MQLCVCCFLRLRSATTRRITQRKNSVGCVNWLYHIIERETFTVGADAGLFFSNKCHRPNNIERVHSSSSCDGRGEVQVCAERHPHASNLWGVSFAESLKFVETIDHRISL